MKIQARKDEIQFFHRKRLHHGTSKTEKQLKIEAILDTRVSNYVTLT